MTKSEFYLALHLIAVIVWLGGSLCLQITAVRAQAAGDRELRIFTFRNTGWIGQRFFLGSSLVVLVTGLLMVEDQNLSLGEGWISFGFTILVLSAILGTFFLGPESGRVGQLMEKEGPDSPEVDRRYQRVLMLSRIELFFLFLVVADMVAKPGA